MSQRIPGTGGLSARIAFICVFLAILGLETYVLVLAYREDDVVLPTKFGNFERARALLKDDKESEEFCFAAVGDIRGHGKFEQIFDELKDEPLSFMFLVGDSVRNGTPGRHRWLKARWAELDPPFPVFYVVGNHDINREKFPIDKFEETYGPANFWFGYKGCLFIALRVTGRPSPIEIDETLTFLESVLESQRHRYRKVFVFMHVPPVSSPKLSEKNVERSDEYIALFDRFRVDYVISGHYHRYGRIKLKDTVYIITGGGGSDLEEHKFGSFHHAVIIKVGLNSISEDIVSVDAQNSVIDGLRRFALAETRPWMNDHLILFLFLNGGIFACCFWLLRGIFLQINQWRAQRN